MWTIVYRDQMLGEINPEEIELTDSDEDMRELDRFMEEQEQAWAEEHRITETLTGTHTMSGAQVPIDWRASQAEPLAWGPWK